MLYTASKRRYRICPRQHRAGLTAVARRLLAHRGIKYTKPSSQANLKFGIWVAEPVLLRESTRFLVELLHHSEDLDPDAQDLQPDLVEPDYDDVAFAEVLADHDEAEGAPW
jgi:hypothetical protein